MEEDAFFKPFFSKISIPSFSSLTDDNENWDTVKSNSYVSPDGNVRIHSTFRSKNFGLGDDDSRPSILTGPDAPNSMFNQVSERMDKEFKNAFEGFKDFEKDMEKKFENFGARMIGNPKIITTPNLQEIEPMSGPIVPEPQVNQINMEQAELDQNVFYLLCTMAFLLLLLSAILGAMTWLYRKRGRQQIQRNHVDRAAVDAPPTYHSATTQAIVKMTPEGEPLKGQPEECPPPYKN